MEHLRAKFEKFNRFAEKYYLVEILAIIFFCLIMFVFYYGRTESFLVDSGREAYLPLRVLEGKLLYKDLFNVYGPLSYQINAVAYSIFGINLNTLYLMGLLNSFLILFSIFFLTNFFTNRKIALGVTFLVIVSCVFIKTFFNFIFPYSYAAVYSLSAFLLSAASQIAYYRYRNKYFLTGAFFFAGIAFANKIEYLPYFCFLFFLLFITKTDWKTKLMSAGSFFVVPVLSFGILFLQGVGFKDFYNAYVLINDIVKTPALEYFYKNYGLYYNFSYLKYSVRTFLRLAVFLVPASLLLYGLNYVTVNVVKNKILKKALHLFTFGLLIFTSFRMFDVYNEIQLRFFTWIGLFCLVVLICFAIFYFITFMKNGKRFYPVPYLEKSFVFLLTAAIAVSLKGLFAVGTECYGTFSLAVLLLPFTVFCVHYLPDLCKIVDRDIWNRTVVNLIFIVIVLIFSGVVKKAIENPLYPVISPRGLIFVKESTKEANTLVQYIIKNIPQGAKIVTMPEGALINFMTGRRTDDMYYYLIPVNVQLFGEDKIIRDFRKNPPEYFLLNSLPYYCFNTSNICQYAPGICNFIEENYQPVAKTQSGLEFYLYKRVEKPKKSE